MSPLAVLLMAVAIVATFAWLQGEAHQPPPKPQANGEVELRHRSRYLALSIACAVLGPGVMIFVTFQVGLSRSSDLIPFLLLVVALGLGGPWMLVDALRTRVRISPEGLRASSAFYRGRFLRWADIERVSYNHLCSCFVLRTANAPPIRVNRNLPGIALVLRRLREHVPSTAYSRIARHLAGVRKDAA